MGSFDALNNIWYGPKVDRSEDNRLTLRESLIESFRRTPGKIFQISDDEGTKLTFKETETLSIKIAKNLKKFGVKKDDVVAMLLFNSTYAAPIAFGCILNGIALAPFLFRQGITPEGLKTSLNISKPKAIILEEFVNELEMIAQVISDIKLDCKIFTVGTDKKSCKSNVFSLGELLRENDDDNEFDLTTDDGITDETIFCIIPSSGSTGTPKSIAINGQYGKLIKYVWKDRDNAVIFSYTNLSWISGVCALFFPFVNNGLRIISKEKFSPKHFARIVRTYGVTATICSVEHTTMLMKSPDFKPEDFTSMKEFLCGGERVPCSVREFLKSNLKPGCFGVAYGSTETFLLTKFNDIVDTSNVKDNIVGVVKENSMCKIIDIRTGKFLGANEVGEICAKTETMFTCYYGNLELTSKVVDAEGWYKTGDIGYFDNIGGLHVHGRINDMINVDGELLHLATLENIFESIDGVKGTCVVEVVQGGVLAVLVTILPNSNITEEHLKKFSDKNFSKVKFIGGIHIVDEIPRTNSVGNKILRSDAKKLAIDLINIKKLQNIANELN